MVIKIKLVNVLVVSLSTFLLSSQSYDIIFVLINPTIVPALRLSKKGKLSIFILFVN